MAGLIQINTVCNTSTGFLMGQIQRSADREGLRTLSIVGRRKPFEDLNCVRIGDPVSFWLHVVLTTVTDRHGYGSVSATKKMIGLLRKEDPDIIHLHNLHGYYLNLPLLFDYLKNEFRGKLFWTLHDCWPFTGHCAFYTAAGCEKRKTGCGNCPNKTQYPVSLFLDSSERNLKDKKAMYDGLSNLTLLVPSEWMKEQVKGSILADHPVHVVPNGVDLSVFRPSARREELFEKYGLDRGKKHLIGVASVWDGRKGLSDLLRLWERIRNDPEMKDRYEMLLVGLSGPQIRKLPGGIRGIRRTDDRNELAGLYALSDIFLNPSLEESFSLVTVEAMACGTPAVVLDTSAVKELVNEVSGIVLHEHGPEEYLNAIRKLSEKEKDPEAVSGSVRKYDASLYGERVLQLYDSGRKE